MLMKGLLTSGLIAALSVVPGTPMPSTPATDSDEWLRATPELAWHAMVEAASKCTVTCWDHTGTGVHAAPTGGNANERGDGAHTTTYPGSCDDKHPFCGGESFAFTGYLQDAIERGDIDSIRQLLEDKSRNVVVVLERNAIQLVGCRGDVTAHIQLPVALLNSVVLE